MYDVPSLCTGHSTQFEKENEEGNVGSCTQVQQTQFMHTACDCIYMYMHGAKSKLKYIPVSEHINYLARQCMHCNTTYHQDTVIPMHSFHFGKSNP